MGYTFKVPPDTLIPRRDTELICEFLINNLPAGGKFADLCTGSGCIPISALLMREDARGVCVELYPETMAVARENARCHGVDDRLEFILGDVTEDVLHSEFDMIVSNPPYVTVEEMTDISPEVEKEPAHALTDGGDGLSIIRKIIEIYPAHIKPGGLLAIEFGWKQGQAVTEIARDFGYESEILSDCEGRDRVIVVKC
jgi:release factor glutamine methyltransferase